MKARTLGICMAMLVVTAGCVSSGYRFTRPQPATLVLGKTTYEEIVRQVGEPVRTGTMVKNDQPLKFVSYAYICFDAVLCSGEDATGEWRLIGMRGMYFYFLDDALVGYHYTSTFSDDKTDFDDTKAYQLKKGHTTRSQVIELLGKPSGIYIYPMISSKTDTALVYVYLGIKRQPLGRPWGRPEVTRKRLVVSFDTQDLATGAEFGPGEER